MDLKRKEEIARAAISSISTHDDEGSVVRKAILDRLSAFIETEKTEAEARDQARIAALTDD